MRFTLSLDVVRQLVNTSVRACEARSVNPEHQCVSIIVFDGKVSMCAAGELIGVCVRSGVEGWEGGRTKVSGHLLKAAVATFRGDSVEFCDVTNAIEVTCGGATFRLAEMVGDMPRDDQAPPSHGLSIGAEDLRAAVASVSMCTASGRGSGRYMFNGPCLEPADGVLAVIGTDGRQMSVAKIPYSGPDPPDPHYLIHESVAAHLQDFNGIVNVTFPSGSSVMIQSPTMQVRGRIYHGRYPKWRAVMENNKESHSLLLPAAALADALSQVRVVASMYEQKSCSPANFTFSRSGLKISTECDGSGTTVSVPCSIEGDTVKLQLNIDLLRSYLRTCSSGEEVELLVNNTPGVLQIKRSLFDSHFLLMSMGSF